MNNSSFSNLHTDTRPFYPIVTDDTCEPEVILPVKKQPNYSHLSFSMYNELDDTKKKGVDKYYEDRCTNQQDLVDNLLKKRTEELERARKYENEMNKQNK